MHLAVVVLFGFVAAAVGTLGGIGGAVLLVPALVLGGLEPSAAAAVGLLAVAAGSLASAPAQIERGYVNHRLGVLIELPATAGTATGALLVGVISETALQLILGSVAVLAAAASARPNRTTHREAPPSFVAETSGEWPGVIGGTIRERGAVHAYQARRLPLGLTLAGAAGVVAGVSGTGGGFLKTPTMSEVMGVPVKVAAATTTFVSGLTAATGLIVHLGQGSIDARLGAAVVLGALSGGVVGARIQERTPPRLAEGVLAILLAGVGIIVLVGAP